MTPSRDIVDALSFDIEDWFHIVKFASHSYWHRMVYELSEDEFREDMQQSIDVIENASGTKVLGFCAPSFSITPGCEWAFDVLHNLGLKYDAGFSNTAQAWRISILERPTRVYRRAIMVGYTCGGTSSSHLCAPT